MSQIKIGSIKTAICPVCNGLRNCRGEGHLHKNQDVNEYVYFSDDYYILVCLGCDCVFFQKERLDSETIDQLRDPDDNEDPQKYIIKTTWPAVVKRRAPEWFKNDHIDTGIFSTERLDQTLKESWLVTDISFPKRKTTLTYWLMLAMHLLTEGGILVQSKSV